MMKKICFIGGRGAGAEFSTRVCGPDRLALELSKRLPKDYTSIRFSFPASFCSFFTMLKVIKRFNPDIIHGHGSLNMALLLVFLQKCFHKKTILTFTDFKKNVTQNYKILNKLDQVVVLSLYAAKRLQFHGVRSFKVNVVKYGVEDSFYNAANNSKIRKRSRKLVLYYGDARSERGFHILLKSLKHIKKDITVLICIRKFLPGFTPSILNHQKKNVYFLHVKDYPCPIQDIIKSVDVVVLPFIQNTLEPPLTLMEVSAVGTPLITTDVGGNKEVVAEGTVLLKESNPELLAAAINSHFEKPVQKGKCTVNSWDETLARFKEIYA